MTKIKRIDDSCHLLDLMLALSLYYKMKKNSPLVFVFCIEFLYSLNNFIMKNNKLRFNSCY